MAQLVVLGLGWKGSSSRLTRGTYFVLMQDALSAPLYWFNQGLSIQSKVAYLD